MKAAQLRVEVTTNDCEPDTAYAHIIDEEYASEVINAINILYGSQGVISIYITPAEPDSA